MSRAMKQWVNEVEESLAKALDISKDGSIQIQNMYMLAPIIYSERHKTNNESLVQDMIETNDRQVKRDWSCDEESKNQYKFHFVSSYLFCFVVAGKIDEFRYDEIMDLVNRKLDLFTDYYEA